MNEYTSFAGNAQQFDDNGNQTDDGERLFIYDALNRIIEIRNKENNEVIATYKYDFMNRRIQKQFTKVEIEEVETEGNVGEYQTDEDTVALYHYNKKKKRKVKDSSGNKNHGKAPRSVKREQGLFGTTAAKFKGAPILVKPTSRLKSIKDKLTVETFVFLEADNWHRYCKSGSLVHQLGSYRLAVDRKTQKACFTIVTEQKQHKNKHRKYRRNRFWRGKGKKQTATICSDNSIPLNEWVHIAAVYDGETITLFVNCQQQAQQKSISGNIHLSPAPLFLGGVGFFGKMEETRI